MAGNFKLFGIFLGENSGNLKQRYPVQILRSVLTWQVSQQQLEKLTISTRYHPQTAFSVSGNNLKNNNGSTNNYQIGSNSNAVTVVKVSNFFPNGGSKLW